jgi:aquaporin Z
VAKPGTQLPRISRAWSGRQLGLFASPISGASMNPARTLGPDIVSGDFTGWWVYVAGDAIAVMLIILVLGMPRTAEREAAEGRDVPVR